MLYFTFLPILYASTGSECLINHLESFNKRLMVTENGRMRCRFVRKKIIRLKKIKSSCRLMPTVLVHEGRCASVRTSKGADRAH